MFKKFNILLYTMMLALTVNFLTGCSEEISSKNMEQIYEEQGIPVKTTVIKERSFTKGLQYNAVLTGIKESSAYASFGSKVESINYNIGDYVKKDAVVMSFPTDDPGAQYFQTKLAYENSLSTYNKMKEFYNSGGLSKQEFENAETAYKVTEANWNSVKQTVFSKAPISGILTSLDVKETENVDKEVKLFTISQIDKLKSRIWVSDNEINAISKGQPVICEWNGLTLTGKVTQVDFSMNQMRKAFAVDVEFDNTNQKVRPGVTAKITVDTYTNENSIFIERKNIIKLDTLQFVYLNNNGTAKKQMIQTGLSSGIDVEVTQGLKIGDELIVEGQMLLEDNKKINVVTE